MYQERSSISADWGLPNVAITMDGQIVANMITTGVLRVASSSSSGISETLFSADMTNNTVKIAGFTVKGSALYTNTKSQLDSDDYGIYIGNDGISHSSGPRHMIFADGEILGLNLGSYGYITFGSVEDPSGSYGLRMGGRTYIALDSGGWFGISTNWVGKDGYLYCESGASGNVSLDSQATLTFVKGLCTGWS
jgi:hypothetical protein